MVLGAPAGYHALQPYLICRNANEAIAFYEKVFEAEVLLHNPGPDGARILHAALKIGDAVLLLCDEYPEWNCLSPQAIGNTGCGIHVYTADVDAVFHRAVIAGSDVKTPPMDMFWGDRFCRFVDPFGHLWSVATHREDVSTAELAERTRAFFAQVQQQQ